MILGAYSWRDIKSGYSAPMFEINDAVALRNFKFASSNESTIIGKNPTDFELIKVGDFNTDTGEFSNLERTVICETV